MAQTRNDHQELVDQFIVHLQEFQDLGYSADLPTAEEIAQLKQTHMGIDYIYRTTVYMQTLREYKEHIKRSLDSVHLEPPGDRAVVQVRMDAFNIERQFNDTYHQYEMMAHQQARAAEIEPVYKKLQAVFKEHAKNSIANIATLIAGYYDEENINLYNGTDESYKAMIRKGAEIKRDREKKLQIKIHGLTLLESLYYHPLYNQSTQQKNESHTVATIYDIKAQENQQDKSITYKFDGPAWVFHLLASSEERISFFKLVYEDIVDRHFQRPVFEPNAKEKVKFQLATARDFMRAQIIVHNEMMRRSGSLKSSVPFVELSRSFIERMQTELERKRREEKDEKSSLLNSAWAAVTSWVSTTQDPSDLSASELEKQLKEIKLLQGEVRFLTGRADTLDDRNEEDKKLEEKVQLQITKREYHQAIYALNLGANDVSKIDKLNREYLLLLRIFMLKNEPYIGNIDQNQKLDKIIETAWTQYCEIANFVKKPLRPDRLKHRLAILEKTKLEAQEELAAVQNEMDTAQKEMDAAKEALLSASWNQQQLSQLPNLDRQQSMPADLERGEPLILEISNRYEDSNKTYQESVNNYKASLKRHQASVEHYNKCKQKNSELIQESDREIEKLKAGASDVPKDPGVREQQLKWFYWLASGGAQKLINADEEVQSVLSNVEMQPYFCEFVTYCASEVEKTKQLFDKFVGEKNRISEQRMVLYKNLVLRNIDDQGYYNGLTELQQVFERYQVELNEINNRVEAMTALATNVSLDRHIETINESKDPITEQKQALLVEYKKLRHTLYSITGDVRFVKQNEIAIGPMQETLQANITTCADDFLNKKEETALTRRIDNIVNINMDFAAVPYTKQALCAEFKDEAGSADTVADANKLLKLLVSGGEEHVGVTLLSIYPRAGLDVVLNRIQTTLDACAKKAPELLAELAALRTRYQFNGITPEMQHKINEQTERLLQELKKVQEATLLTVNYYDRLRPDNLGSREEVKRLFMRYDLAIRRACFILSARDKYKKQGEVMSRPPECDGFDDRAFDTNGFSGIDGFLKSKIDHYSGFLPSSHSDDASPERPHTQ